MMSNQAGHRASIHDSAKVESSETAFLISLERVEGTSVFSSDGEKLGSVHNLMINKMSGQISYVVVSIGGFLGIGSYYNAVPWDKLRYNMQLDGYELDASRELLTTAPHYAADQEPWTDPNYGQSIDQHYMY